MDTKVYHMAVHHVMWGGTGVMDSVLSALMVHLQPSLLASGFILVGILTAVRIFSFRIQLN